MLENEDRFIIVTTSSRDTSVVKNSIGPEMILRTLNKPNYEALSGDGLLYFVLLLKFSTVINVIFFLMEKCTISEFAENTRSWGIAVLFIAW